MNSSRSPRRPDRRLPNRQRLGNPQIDKNGILWVADGPNGRWLSYDTKYAKFASFQWPKGHGNAGGNSMAVAPDGKIYATGLGKEVRMLDPSTAEYKFFESPSAKGPKEPGAYGLTVSGDGAVWWAEDNIDLMARIDPVTGKVDEYKIPYEGGHAFPRRMGADANGDVWVALWQAGKLMKIDHKTKEMKIFSPPTAECRRLFGGGRQEERSRLDERAQGRQDRPVQSQDRGMGRVPAAGIAIRSAPRRHRSDQPEPGLFQRQHRWPGRLRGSSPVRDHSQNRAKSERHRNDGAPAFQTGAVCAGLIGDARPCPPHHACQCRVMVNEAASTTYRSPPHPRTDIPRSLNQSWKRLIRGTPTTLAGTASADTANRRARDRCLS